MFIQSLTEKNQLKLLFLSLGKSVIASILVILLSFGICPIALAKDSGEGLFLMHCSGCHVKGGNIVRRSKTLKLKALKSNGLDNPDAIARVAREGIGSMSGYQEVLGKGGDQLVAIWVWEQAQKAWVQG
ncbi:c-type cytochrome [Prochlorococcus sp. MIT 1307]|uniref:c-type cytochrome n=1 Tax=Prochlorococcus sp. MIT 1307 TaxID=3096219 RepID=UPI002A75A9E6|nr:c-type cytochrome [Prochlorococcus sp. MIT 1307]